MSDTTSHSDILIVGGAGYIGSHLVKLLVDQGHNVTVADNFSTGFYEAAVDAGAHRIINLDISDFDQVNNLFLHHKFLAVFHFASFSQVSESVKDPLNYYHNNIAATLNLIKGMLNHKIFYFIFSSTAAVYGSPIYTPIDETHPTQAISPYGKSKLMVEDILSELDGPHGLKSVSLRYFNAAGADESGIIGERHDPESHLIPIILQAASGRRNNITIYGDDYPTPDGTCIRDYIHVTDLAKAHWLALKHLIKTNQTSVFNLGNSQGYSVREVIDTVKSVTGTNFNIEISSRRAGDPPRLVADSTKASEILSWTPEFGSLEKIISDAWKWEQKWPWK